MCFILPRVVQLLLWYFREHEAYYIVSVLLKETKIRERTEDASFFPFGLSGHKQLIDVVLGYLTESYESITENQVRVIVSDVLSNILVGYVPPVIHSVILCYFIRDGLCCLTKLSVALLKQTLPKSKDLFNHTMEYSELIQVYKDRSVHHLNIMEFLKSAHKLKIKLEKAVEVAPATVEDLLCFAPQLEGTSLILTSSGQVSEVISILPLPYLHSKIRLVFSLIEYDRKLSKLMKILQDSLHTFILIELNEEIFGIFLDRPYSTLHGIDNSESLIFHMTPSQIIKEPCPFLSIQAEKTSGFSICTQTGPVLSLNPSLDTLTLSSTHEIQNIEVFELSILS